MKNSHRELSTSHTLQMLETGSQSERLEQESLRIHSATLLNRGPVRCNLTHDELATRLDAIFANCFNSGPVSDASIDDAERELGLRFPASYRTYLRRYGASFGSGFEIHGLPPKPADDIPPQWSDVVASTMRLRPSSLPQDSVEISHDGMDHGYFLQCSPTDARYEGPVIEWGPDHDGGKEVCSDFLEFVTTRCCT